MRWGVHLLHLLWRLLYQLHLLHWHLWSRWNSVLRLTAVRCATVRLSVIIRGLLLLLTGTRRATTTWWQHHVLLAGIDRRINTTACVGRARGRGINGPSVGHHRWYRNLLLLLRGHLIHHWILIRCYIDWLLILWLRIASISNTVGAGVALL